MDYSPSDDDLDLKPEFERNGYASFGQRHANVSSSRSEYSEPVDIGPVVNQRQYDDDEEDEEEDSPYSDEEPSESFLSKNSEKYLSELRRKWGEAATEVQMKKNTICLVCTQVFTPNRISMAPY